MSAPSPPPPPPVSAVRSEAPKSTGTPASALQADVAALAASRSTPSDQVVDVLVPGARRTLTIVFVSDTHNRHDRVRLPPGDVFIHAGDFTDYTDWQGVPETSLPASVKDFNEWLGRLPYKHKVVVAGNHEVGFSNLNKKDIQKALSHCTYVQDEAVKVAGIKIYGSPWTTCKGMGFGTRSLEKKWRKIPSRIDVLVTHQPPAGIKDRARSRGKLVPWGCPKLLERVEAVKPRVHLFGHVHDDVGVEERGGTVFVNGAFDIFHNTYVLHLDAA